jgi:hypothetical protein
MTSKPSTKSLSTVWLPINPAPPVTKTLKQPPAKQKPKAKYMAEKVDEAKPLSEALHTLYNRLSNDRPPPDEAIWLVEEAKATMKALASKPYKSAEVRKFAAKMLNGLDHWFTFLTTPGVEPTNNRAERALREHVVQRKIMGTLRNGKGTFIHETITTVLATWKQQGQNPTETLPKTITLKWQNS